MRRRVEPEDPSANTGAELTQFFAGLDETKLSEYHADPSGYVKAQQERGLVSDDAAQLILDGSLEDVQASMRSGGSGSTVNVVFPPM